MQDHLIFLPVVFLVLVTLSLYVFLFIVRVKLLKKGEAKISDFSTYEQEVTESRKWSRALANQYETPVLFYCGALVAAFTHSVDMVMLTLAWLYVLVKTAHVVIHVTSNRLRYRQRAFTVAYFFLILQWLWLAIHLLGLL